jgi:hypothetical protein
MRVGVRRRPWLRGPPEGMERSSGAGRVAVDRDQPVGSSARHVEAAADIAATRSREPADRVTRSGEADRRHDDRTPEPSEKARLIVANPTHRATRTGRRRNAVNLRRWGRGRRRGQRKNRQLAANGRRRHVSTEPSATRRSTGGIRPPMRASRVTARPPLDESHPSLRDDTRDGATAWLFRSRARPAAAACARSAGRCDPRESTA